MLTWACGLLPDNVLMEVQNDLIGFEGSSSNMYLDSVSTVTVGVGTALEAVTEVDSINFVYANNLKSQASIADKRAAWNTVQAISQPRGKACNFAAGYFQTITNIIIQQPEIDRLLNLKLQEFYMALLNIYPGFDSMPDQAKIGLFDMIYNLGPEGIEYKFPHFTKAIRARDWATAAAQSDRPQVGARRNATTKARFMKCAGIITLPAPPLVTLSKSKPQANQQNAKLPPPPIPFPPTPFKSQIPPALRVVTSPLIKQGDRGVDVRTVQYALNRVLAGRLPALALDGVFGPHVGNAVRSAQSHAGIGADGMVGAATRQALDLTLA